MKAIVTRKAYDLRIEECSPAAPGPGEVLLRVAAGGICGSDLYYYRHGRVRRDPAEATHGARS